MKTFVFFSKHKFPNLTWRMQCFSCLCHSSWRDHLNCPCNFLKWESSSHLKVNRPHSRRSPTSSVQWKRNLLSTGIPHTSDKTNDRQFTIINYRTTRKCWITYGQFCFSRFWSILVISSILVNFTTILVYMTISVISKILVNRWISVNMGR